MDKGRRAVVEPAMLDGRKVSMDTGRSRRVPPVLRIPRRLLAIETIDQQPRGVSLPEEGLSILVLEKPPVLGDAKRAVVAG